MQTRLSILTLSTVLIMSLLATPALAVNMVDNYQEWILTPDSTQGHPKKHTVAYLVTESFPLTVCEIGYTINRYAAGSAIAVEVRGKMKATLKVITRNGAVKIGTRKIRIGAERFGGSAFLMWAGPSGADWYESVNTARLPLNVEPGDVIEWTVKFSGTNNLGVDDTTEPSFRDVITLRAGYYNCGTVDHPCL